ncbi:hypothetical protein [Arthrobacter alpinus]|uniref:hypothetical protein n=1 Tax=Arthrobacter alpinus TaxID=656366 RepID=UPI0018D0BBA9|nr:hypothetical protein [Arthrobacter alpinus]
MGIELLLYRQWLRFVNMVFLGLAIGAVVLLVFLPLMESSSVLMRQPVTEAMNSGYLRPQLGDLFALSLPGFQPHFSAWYQIRDVVPSTYLAWFVAPLLPWINIGFFKERWRSLISLFLFAGLYLLLVLAPSELWLFRWPLRTIEYFYVAVAVLFSVAISGGLASNHRKIRLGATSAILLFGYYYAWAETPQNAGFHFLIFAVLVAATATALLFNWKVGIKGLVVVMVSGTVVVTAIITPHYFWTQHEFGYDADIRQVQDLNVVTDRNKSLTGNVLIQSSLSKPDSQAAILSGDIISGNVSAAAGIDTLGRYTGIGFSAFSDALYLDYRGAPVYPFAVTALFLPAGGGFNGTLADSLRVDSVVVQKGFHNDNFLSIIPDTWEVTSDDQYRYVLHRKASFNPGGTVSLATSDIAILNADSSPHHEELRVDAQEAGSLLFARLAWPGYRATIDGQSVPVSQGPAGLLMLDVPLGEHTVVIDYRTPGLRPGLAAVALASIAVVVGQILFQRGMVLGGTGTTSGFGKRRNRKSQTDASD